MIGIPVEMPDAEAVERPPNTEAGAAPRRLHIKAKDFEKYGFI